MIGNQQVKPIELGVKPPDFLRVALAKAREIVCEAGNFEFAFGKLINY
jgi:hypothetical protein